MRDREDLRQHFALASHYPGHLDPTAQRGTQRQIFAGAQTFLLLGVQLSCRRLTDEA